MERPPLHRRGSSRVRFAEEDGGDESRPPVARAHSSDTVVATHGVFWDGRRDTDPNASKYTFYREGTPTPPDYDDGEKSAFAYGAAAGLADIPPAHLATHYRSNYAASPASDPYGSGRSGSMAESQGSRQHKKSKYRWLILAFAVLFITVPIGVGVGLGVGLKTRSPGKAPQSASSASSDTPDPTTSSSPSVVPTSTGVPVTLTSSGASAEPTNFIPDALDCPGANNTIYSVPDSTKTFLRTCGVDYTGPGGAADLAHAYTNSMNECMNACASYDRCTGCGWGPVEGDTGEAHRCWMKNDLRAGRKTRADFCFAILQTS